MRLLRSGVALLLALALGACASLVDRASSRLGEQLSAGIRDHDDPATVAAGLPAYLLLLDGLNHDGPDHPGRLCLAADLYGAYAGAFVDDTERARRLARRALDYAERAACATERHALLGLPADAEHDEGGLAGNVGRTFLTAEDTPAYRGALYLSGDEDARAVGESFRNAQHRRVEGRLASETVEAQLALATTTRAVRLKGLDTLARIGPAFAIADVRALVEDPDRRVATAARHALKLMSFADLPERILAYADASANPARLRAVAYRVLAEHYPSTLSARHTMLRVHPDARIQRAVVPVIVEMGEPTDLASMLAANPWSEHASDRPGLLELRIELIERLALHPDPRALLPLLAAVAADPPPSSAEMAAVTRALVAYPDPRARHALSLAAQRLERPAVP